jgi:tripartite-type tricarboxylate transporter receptor subunit TctC
LPSPGHDGVSDVVPVGAFATIASLCVVHPSLPVRALAVTSRERSRFTPGLPTMIEAGVPDFDITSWFGVTAPVGTPPKILARRNAALRAATADAAMAERLSGMGAEPLSMTPGQFGAFLRGERERCAEVIRVSGAKVD